MHKVPTIPEDTARSSDWLRMTVFDIMLIGCLMTFNATQVTECFTVLLRIGESRSRVGASQRWNQTFMAQKKY